MYIKSAVVLGKLYGPSIVIGAASVAALTGSHVLIRVDKFFDHIDVMLDLVESRF